jgi:enamine deaminase RidA (YjgF/YER057c/UK114 family)
MKSLIRLNGVVSLIACAVVAATWTAESGSAQAPAAKPPATRPARAAAPGPDAVRYINPEGLFESDTYSKAVSVPSRGRTVFFSGEIPVDAEFNVVGRGDLRTQTKAVLKNLGIAMAAAKVGKGDVVKLSVMIVYSNPRDTFIVAEELKNFFDRENMPATTMVGVPFIVAEGISIQIEAVAAVKP